MNPITSSPTSSRAEPPVLDLLNELSMLTKSLQETPEVQKGRGKPSQASKEVAETSENFKSIFNKFSNIIASVIGQLEKLPEMSNKICDLEKRARLSEDQVDHHHQRSLKGKFILSPSSEFPLPDQAELESMGTSISQFTCEKISQKYGVKPKLEDLKSCHFSRTGIIFRLNNLSPESCYGHLVHAIKSGEGKENNSFYLNFALTPKRASLLFHLRQLKKAKAISKFLVDSNGALGYTLEERGPKTKITSLYNNVERSLYTLSTLEILDSFPPPSSLQNGHS